MNAIKTKMRNKLPVTWVFAKTWLTEAVLQQWQHF
jgi:hypothetical protein